MKFFSVASPVPSDDDVASNTPTSSSVTPPSSSASFAATPSSNTVLLRRSSATMVAAATTALQILSHHLSRYAISTHTTSTVPFSLPRFILTPPNLGFGDEDAGMSVELVFRSTASTSKQPQTESGTPIDTEKTHDVKERLRRVSMVDYLTTESPMSLFPESDPMRDIDVERDNPASVLSGRHFHHTVHVHRHLLRRLFLEALSLPYDSFKVQVQKLSRRLRRMYLREDNVRLVIPGEGLGVKEVRNILGAIKEDLAEGVWRTWQLPMSLVFPAWLAAPTSDARQELLLSHTSLVDAVEEEARKCKTKWDLEYPISNMEADTGLAVMALFLVPGLEEFVRVDDEDIKYVMRIIGEQKRGWKSHQDVWNWMQVQRFGERGIRIAEEEVKAWWNAKV